MRLPPSFIRTQHRDCANQQFKVFVPAEQAWKWVSAAAIVICNVAGYGARVAVYPTHKGTDLIPFYLDEKEPFNMKAAPKPRITQPSPYPRQRKPPPAAATAGAAASSSATTTATAAKMAAF